MVLGNLNLHGTVRETEHGTVKLTRSGGVKLRYRDRQNEKGRELMKYLSQKLSEELDPESEKLSDEVVQQNRRSARSVTPSLERKIDFSDEEIKEAYAHLKATKDQYDMQDMALATLTDRNQRLPKYIYAIIPDALRALDRQLQRIKDEVTLFKHERKTLGDIKRSAYYLLQRGRSVESIAAKYMADIPKNPTKYFRVLMAYLILNRGLLRLASVVMEAIAKSPAAPHPRDIGMACRMLVRERLQPFDNPDGGASAKARARLEKEGAACTELLFRMLERPNKWPMQVPQVVMHDLLHRVPVSMLPKLYWMLVDRNVKIYPFTAFHFIKRLRRLDPATGISLWRDAFAILKSMQYRREDLNTQQAQFAFFGVLYQAMCDKDAAATEEILKLMIECGLSPGIEVYHMLMSRAMEENDGAKMKKYYRSGLDAGYEPTMVTFSILHAFHKRHGPEPDRQKVMHEAYLLDNALNLFLSTDILHADVLQGKPYHVTFARYKSLFNTRVLEEFGISPSKDRPGEKRKIDPDHVTLAVMISAYCNSEYSISRIWDLYRLYQEKLKDKRISNGSIRKLLIKAGPYIPHAIMMGLGKRIEGLPYVAKVLQHMLLPDSIVQSDVYSWSILLSFLAKAGKLWEAKKTMKLMKSRGLTPNVVTWSTLLNGYVKSNLVAQAEDVLEKMKIAGVDPNVYTWTSLLNGYVTEGKDWEAGEVFKRMLDAQVSPDEITLSAVSGVKDRTRFEAGLAGETKGDWGEVEIERAVEDCDGEDDLFFGDDHKREAN